MSTIKANALTGATTNSDLTLSGNGTGGVKLNDYFVQTKGSDISSATSLTLGKDGNLFDVTGTTTITTIGTQGIGSIVTLQFDAALTFTHHSTNLILPGAVNIITAAGDIAVMYEYASADWRCVSYTRASGKHQVSSEVSAESFNLPITLNGTDGSSSNARDNIVLDGSAASTDVGERLLYEDSTLLDFRIPETAITNVANTFTKAQSGSITALTDASTIAVNLALNNHFSVTLAGNRTLDNPTNIVAGTSGSFFITQDGTGSRTLSYGSYYDFAAGTAPTLTTTASKIDRIDYIARTTTSLHCVHTGDLS